MQIFGDVGKRFPRYDLPKKGKIVDFCDKTSQSNVNNFFLLEVGCSMIALFKALIWLYNSYLTNYKKSQKPKSSIFW